MELPAESWRPEVQGQRGPGKPVSREKSGMHLSKSSIPGGANKISVAEPFRGFTSAQEAAT